MSQALDLLNSLTDEEIAAYSAGNGENEPHVIIGDDRYIKVPESLKRVAVQYDHDVETVIFDCPRYWDGLDMSEMAIYINYIRSDKYGDSYPAKNVTVEDDIMHFEWTISRNVTAVKGQLAFLVCIKKSDDEGNEVNHWNSEICTDMYISEGMETEEQIEDLSSDLVTQLLLRMDSVEQINVDSETMTQLLADTTEEANRAEDARDEADAILAEVAAKDDYIKDMYANAVKGNVSGEIVRVDDVSPIEHDVKCYIHGKNLLNIPDTVVEGNYAWCNTLIGSFELDPGTYTLSVDFTQQGSDSSKVSISARKYEEVTVQYASTSSTEASGRLNITFTIPDGEKGFTLYAYSNITANVLETNCAFSNFQIEKGSILTEYTPFIDATTVKLTRCGKAIFSKSTQVVSGVSKPWTSLLVAAVKVPPGDYVVSCRFNQVGQDMSTVGISARSYNDYTVLFGGATSAEKSGYLEKAFTVTEGSGGFQIFLYSNMPNEALTTECSFENICVEVGSVATGYSLYNGVNYTPNADGTVSGVMSISSDMIIFTDTEGIVIEAEYNRDTTKMFESYVLTDKAKSEIVDEIEYDLDKQYGNIESALDEIIEIQEDLLVPNGDEVSY